MDVREKLVEQAISHFWYGVSHDIFSEPVTTYAKLAIEALEKENGVTVQEWISVDDRLPEEKVNCIVHYKHAYCDNDDYWAIGICFYDGEKFQKDLSYKVTHWMPLPLPPKGE